MCLISTFRAGLENPSFLEKVFRLFLEFSVQIRPDTKFRPRKNNLYAILSVTSFCIQLQLQLQWGYLVPPYTDKKGLLTPGSARDSSAAWWIGIQ